MSLEIQNERWREDYSSNFDYRYTPRTKRAKRHVRNETLEEMSPWEADLPSSVHPLDRERNKRKIDWEDLSFNLMHYVLVPVSGVAIFGILVFAEYSKITGS